MDYDIAIIGGGLGGISAAIASARNGKKVFLSEESYMIGGQVTSQAVPPDEHPYIEKYGRTDLYHEYRQLVRRYYKDYYPVNIKDSDKINPGNAWVSEISHEPVVSWRVLQSMLHPYIVAGLIDLHLDTRPIAAHVEADEIKFVVMENKEGTFEVLAKYFLDATELGDLLPLTNTEYVTGSESKEVTGELHAHEFNDPNDMQAITWCFAVSFEKEGNYTIDKPKLYDYFKEHRSDFWPGSQLSWTYVEPHTLNPINGSIRQESDKVNLFNYRQILDKDNFKKDFFNSNITLVNWPQNDYWLGPIINQDGIVNKSHMYMAKELSKSFLYWLQTEADGIGYPNLKLRGDVTGTKDGFALRPYIREARRIVSQFTVLESHIGAKMLEGNKAIQFKDSVGLGHYHLDLHPSTGQRTYIDIKSYPFQIPMGALIPIRTKNLIPAAKNIGTTHITNGTYRLHPVEWNIGESAGMMAVYAISHNIELHEILNSRHLKKFQDFIQSQGIQIVWPEWILEKEGEKKWD